MNRTRYKLTIKTRTRIMLILIIMMSIKASYGQRKSADSSFHPYGKISGYAFGDFYYKARADSLNRGGSNQYTGIPKGRNAFQLRRVYLGYEYYISPKFSAQVLLDGKATGEQKYSFYIKYAYLKWHNILPGTDLMVGQTSTPAFSNTSEEIWGYRSIEKTIADKQGTPSFDLGIKIQGRLDPKERFGYHLMVGNGRGAELENNKFKRLYGDVYAKFFDKRLMVDVYGDYYRLDWRNGYHHSKAMGKLFIGYTTAEVTFGVEGFVTRRQNDLTATNLNTLKKDTLNGSSAGISVFIRGTIVPDKLYFFARTDFYTPDTKLKTNQYVDYQSLSNKYNPETRGQFITAGLDFTPFKQVHFMPNIWYNSYVNRRENNKMKDEDLVYRLTFYFRY